MVGLQLVDITKSFGGIYAISGVTFDVNKSEIVALLGPSGSGKSTILSIIAGLEAPDKGNIMWEGKSLLDAATNQRDFGLMFQDFALFPHMNVYDNVAFGLRMAGWEKAEIEQTVESTLNLVGLSGFGKRDVNTLSGGEQQRVALARSLAPSPRLLMLDEPLGALDRNLRERLIFELGSILRQTNQTAIYVTHDQEEAFSLADRIVILNHGTVEQIDTPQGIYRQPATVFIARFLGMDNLLHGDIRNDLGSSSVITAIGKFPVQNHEQGPVNVLLRPDGVSADGSGPCQLHGTVVSCSFRGSTCRAVIEVQGIKLVFDFLVSEKLPEVGESIQIGFNPEKSLHIFPTA